MPTDTPMPDAEIHQNICLVYTLKRCIERSKSIEDARKKISTNPEYQKCLNICNRVIFNLCNKFRVNYRTQTHALVLAQLFVSLDSPEGHKALSPDCPFVKFWVCVAFISFNTSLHFHEVNPASLKDMMELSGMSFSDYAKKFYKCVQIHFLVKTQWSLFFPTPIDMFDCIKHDCDKNDTPCTRMMKDFINNDGIHCTICHCCAFDEFFTFSFHAMAVSAWVTAIRSKTLMYNYDPNDGVVEMLLSHLSNAPDLEETLACADLMCNEVRKYMTRK